MLWLQIASYVALEQAESANLAGWSVERHISSLATETGNLGADAAFFGANDSAAAFRMATKSTFGGKEYVEWHSVVAFKELAQEVVEKCTKGRFIRVYGRLHSSKIENEGATQFKTEVVATRIKYLDRKK